MKCLSKTTVFVSVSGIFLFIWLCLAAVNCAPRWQPPIPIAWTRQFGTGADDFAMGFTIDATGVYVAGGTEGTFPGQSSAGGEDAFIRKYDANGNELWTRQFGTGADDMARAVAADATGVYVAGGTFPGQNSADWLHSSVRKYDANGNELWTRQFGTDSSDKTYKAYKAYGVAIDATRVYVAGYTVGTTFPGQNYSSGKDAFVHKYDADGNELWTRQFGTNSDDTAWATAADTTGVYVAGSTGGTFSGQNSAGESDAFVRKYDANSNELWTRQFGTDSDDHAWAIAADTTGVYVAGSTGGTFSGQNGADNGYAFVRKYDANGNELWTQQFGTESAGFFLWSVAADITGVYVAGSTVGTYPEQSSAGPISAFVCKYDADGNELWTWQFGTKSIDGACTVAIDATGVYVTGATGGTFPGQRSAGDWDVFIIKFLK